jgi:hypothetical protein
MVVYQKACDMPGGTKTMGTPPVLLGTSGSTPVKYGSGGAGALAGEGFGSVTTLFCGVPWVPPARQSSPPPIWFCVQPAVVSAKARGALPTAPPIAIAANNGGMYLIAVFKGVLLFADSLVSG